MEHYIGISNKKKTPTKAVTRNPDPGPFVYHLSMLAITDLVTDFIMVDTYTMLSLFTLVYTITA